MGIPWSSNFGTLLLSPLHAWHSMLMTQRSLAGKKKKNQQQKNPCLTESHPVFQKSTLSIDIFLHGPLLRVHKDHGLETQVWLDLDSETDAKASFMPRAEKKQFKSVLMVCQHLCFRQDYFGLIKTDLIQRCVRIENDWPSSFPGLKYKTLAKTFVNAYFDLLENTVLENSAGNTNNNAVHKSSYH